MLSPAMTAAALLLCAGALAIRFRPQMWDYCSYDMRNFVLKWMEAIHSEGFAAYGTEFSNYAPLYTYFLGLFTLAGQQWWMPCVKLLSVAGDLALALAAGGIVHHAARDAYGAMRRNLALLASAAVLWAPTVIINSARWGQCDSLWAASAMLSLLWFIKDRPAGGMVWFGVAFAFKQQAIFFAPVALTLLLSRKAKWQQLLIVPGVYILTCLPCAIAGRGWESLLTVYVAQGTTDMAWNKLAPSPYFLLTMWKAPYSPAAVLAILAAVTLLTVWWCAAVSRRFRELRGREQAAFLLLMCAVCGIVYPYVLPGMHERYMYLGDAAAIAAAFAFLTDMRIWLAACLSVFGSMMTMSTVLDFAHPKAGVASTTVAVGLLVWAFLSRMKRRSPIF